MRTYTKSHIFAIGLAMFSMFFGAGNIVFPLALGQYAQDKSIFAILGLLITAVGVPFLGLVAMTLYDGDYRCFFRRIGAVPGFCITALILGVLGPFGATPRCITLSYAAAKSIFPGLPQTAFSLAACLVIFLFAFRKTRIVQILGYYLTPLLLGSLAVIIFMGIAYSPAAPAAEYSRFDVFLTGLNEGYQTMDLLAAFFFSSVVIAALKKDYAGETYGNLIRISVLASAIGATLLALTYIGFSYVASFNSVHLTGIPKEDLLGTLSLHLLGPYAGLMVCLCVTLATLTTAIALATIFAEFLYRDVFLGKIGYIPSLITTLAATFCVSTLNFNGIASLVGPILEIGYPALIVLCFVNIALKLYKARKAEA